MWGWLVMGAVPVAGAVVALAWRPLRKLGKGIQVERARELFILQRERLERVRLRTVRKGDRSRRLGFQS